MNRNPVIKEMMIAVRPVHNIIHYNRYLSIYTVCNRIPVAVEFMMKPVHNIIHYNICLSIYTVCNRIPVGVGFMTESVVIVLAVEDVLDTGEGSIPGGI